MSQIVEVNEDGVLRLSSDVLGNAKPHTRFEVKRQGETVILLPVESKQPLWATASVQERVQTLKTWVESHHTQANIPDAALRRENIYE